MQDFNLHAPEGANKKKRIIGRGQGSGRGTTAGKGNKGQQSRSGGKTYLGFEGGQMPLYRRLAHRGFSNYPFKKVYQVVNVSELDAKFVDGDVVDNKSLLQKGILKNCDLVKILGDGELNKKLEVKIEKVSSSAKEKITKAGGTVAEFEEKQDPRKLKGVKRSKKTKSEGKING
ncbi:MAG: 50S ribosomal protein L15 [Termitinemataceae bacterium]|nr:MAG: 50S ribosomal protein L15 [Termitinemataceae bacterium]